MGRTTHIMAVSAARGLLAALTRTLEKTPSVRVTPCDGVERALEVLDELRPTLLIVDLELPAGEAGEFLEEVKRRGHSMPVLLLGDPGEVPESWPGNPAVLTRPFSAPRLREAIESLVSVGGEHAASPFSLTDYLQLVALGQHSVRFRVVLEDGTEGIVDVERGVIRHAEWGVHHGLEALRSLLDLAVRTLHVEALPPAGDQGDMKLPVARALLDLAIEADTGGAAPPLEDGAAPEGPGAGDPFEALFARGIEASLAGDHGRARELFSRALELRPGDPRAEHNLRRVEQLLRRNGGNGPGGRH